MWEYLYGFFLQVRLDNEESVSVPEGWVVFDGGEFTIASPPSFMVQSGSALSGGFLPASRVKIGVPSEAVEGEGTNFVEAYLVISDSENSTQVRECNTFSLLSRDQDLDVDSRRVGGVDFSEFKISEAAAGNFYETVLYRTLLGSRCYEAALTVHTGEVENYESRLKKFDEDDAFEKLEDVFRTVSFVRPELR